MSDLSHAVQVIKLYLVNVFLTVGKDKCLCRYKPAGSGNISCHNSYQISPVPGHQFFLLSQLMYLKNMDISPQIWSTKDQTPTEAS